MSDFRADDTKPFGPVQLKEVYGVIPSLGFAISARLSPSHEVMVEAANVTVEFISKAKLLVVNLVIDSILESFDNMLVFRLKAKELSGNRTKDIATNK